ncbi:ATP-binding protein [Streptomyces sp. NPDC003038]|uniref:ATP-binding protein n=1 Tax=unclassified Streptomyces TaxID=2593676 RepID=UPI0033B00C00
MTTLNEAAFRLSRRPRSAPRARAALHAVLGDWGAGDDLLHTAELVLSELVTNALHAPAPSDRQVGIRIAHSSTDGLLRLEVSDAGSGRPELRHPEPDAEHGRGLQLVDALSHRWGVSPRAGGIGKTVWSELKAPDLLPTPSTRQVAAITVRPGQTSVSGAPGAKSATYGRRATPLAPCRSSSAWTKGRPSTCPLRNRCPYEGCRKVKRAVRVPSCRRVRGVRDRVHPDAQRSGRLRDPGPDRRATRLLAAAVPCGHDEVGVIAAGRLLGLEWCLEWPAPSDSDTDMGGSACDRHQVACRCFLHIVLFGTHS